MTENIDILIIEDDQFLREVITQKLNKEGFNARSVIDASAALKSVKEKRPQVILLDLVLPGMNGFEFLGEIKKDPANKDVPVVVLSNLGQKEDKDKAMAAGAVDYLVKSNHTPAEIVEKVRQAVKKKYL